LSVVPGVIWRGPAAAALLMGAAPVPVTLPAYRPDPAAAARVRATVEFLADDLIEGRGTGTRGHQVAALYVASQFRAIGLEPGGNNGGYFVEVPFRRATHDGEPRVALIGAGGRRQALAWGKDVTIRPSLTQAERHLEAPMVFVGWGLSDPRSGFADYRAVDVRGKIAVVFAGTPRGLPTDIRAHLGQQKGRFAAEAGAIGLIEVPGPPPSRDVLSGGQNRPVTDWVDASGRSGDGDGLQLRGAMSTEAAGRLFAGAPMPFAKVRAKGAAKGGGRHFALATRLALDAKAKFTNFTSPEVIGRLRGSDPRLKREHVLLMGHLDHLGIKADAKPGEDAIYNGALDNAAGVATMIEVAHEVAASGRRPRRSMLFIAHTGEEVGLVGSSYYASHPTMPIGDIVAAVDLDMPVPLYDFRDVVAFGADYSTVAQAVSEAGRGMGVTLSPDPMPEQGVFTRSDHYPFVLKGVPAVLLFTGYGEGGKPLWDDFFATRYHSVRDDLSQPILWDAAAKYAALNTRIAWLLANAEARPAWLPGSYFGTAAH
jgi:Peptidase family M28